VYVHHWLVDEGEKMHKKISTWLWGAAAAWWIVELIGNNPGTQSAVGSIATTMQKLDSSLPFSTQCGSGDFILLPLIPTTSAWLILGGAVAKWGFGN
jgi:hypothetical protein